MKEKFFDFEVFPNWWCCIFGDYPEDGVLTESIKDTFRAVTSDSRFSRDELMTELKAAGYVNMGYNVKGYDLIIANGVYQGFTPRQLKILNDIIINPGLSYSTSEHVRISPFAKRRISNVVYSDLLDDSDGTLKQKESTLGLSIMESSVDFDKVDLTEDDKEEIIKYCKHDVYSTMVWYKTIVYPFMKTKLLTAKYFDIPESIAYSCTNPKLVCKALNATRSHFDDEERIQVILPTKIRQYCYDNLPHDILERLMNDNKAFSIRLFDNDVSFGDGGIHSTPRDDIYAESDDEYILMNVDAGSYYPSMMIQFNCLSRTLRHPDLFENIFKERMRIKHKKDKTQDDNDIQLAYKLIMNSTYGASGNKYLDLYDPHQRTRCCRFGQIYLAALGCKMVKSVPTLKVVQTNTDGILVYLKRDYLEKLREVMKEWMDISGILLEEDEVERIWQRNVNNYLMIKKGGKRKVKGAWVRDSYERPGYIKVSPLDAYISARAAQEYLINGKDPIKSIVSCKKLDDFAIACTKGPTYRGCVQRFNDGREVELFKMNRVIATTDTNAGKIYKYKMYKGEIRYAQMPDIPDQCLLINEALDSYNFNEIKKQLDYMYYIQRTVDILDVDWYELSGDGLYKTHRFDYSL